MSPLKFENKEEKPIYMKLNQFSSMSSTMISYLAVCIQILSTIIYHEISLNNTKISMPVP